MASPADKKPVRVRYYRFKNKLKERAVGLGPSSGEPVSIAPEALAAAMQRLDAMVEDYPDWVTTLINELAENHRRCVDTPEERKKYFEAINRVAHDMKGQGGTFGYPLISTFADSLHNFTSANSGMTENHIEIIKAHIDAMRAVIKDRVSGDGGDIGELLTKGLQQAIDKHQGK